MEHHYSKAVTKLSTWLARSAVLVLALGSSAATCSDFEQDPNEPAQCISDAECEEGICYEARCTVECVSDEDCGADEVCATELRADGQIDICVRDTSIPEEPTCFSDADCQDGATCGIDGYCFTPAQAFAVLIEDTTMGADAADGGPGADVVAVFLRHSASGEIQAWGETLDYAPAIDVANAVLPDGAAVELDEAQMCAIGAYEGVAAPLGGAGGTLLVRFLEVLDTGAPGITTPLRTIPADWELVVVEWGANCPDGETGEPDTFDVYICEAETFEGIEPSSDCGVRVGVGLTGNAVVDIAR